MSKIKSFAIALAMLFVLSVCAVLTLDFNAVKADDETQTAPTNVFEMYEGGSIRFNTTDPGMRFKVRMSEDVKKRATADGATLGFVISLTDFFTGYEDNYINVTPKLDVESLKVPAEMIYLDEDGFYYANAVVGSMLETNLTYDYSCVAYLLENGKYSYATYSVEKNSRSWQEVASNSFFAQPEFRAQEDYSIFGTEELPILIDSEGYNSYSALVDLVNGGVTCENLVFELTENVEVEEKLGSAFLGTLNMAEDVNVYYAFTGEETAIDLNMFTVRNSDYHIALNTNADYVNEGDSSIRLYSTSRWPEWYITQDFVDWVNYKEYDYIVFNYYIDQASANTTVGSGGLSSSSSVLINGFTCNSWQRKVYSVSELTSNHCIYLNKGALVTLSVYVDNVQFLKQGEFTGTEEIVDLDMFTLSGNASIEINTDTTYIKEGDTSLKLYSPSQWPRYTFSQKFVDWLNSNEYDYISFDLYIDDAGSTANMAKMEGIVTSYKVDTWFTINLSVSSITTSKYLQFNKDATYTMNMYIDNVKFFYESDFSNEEEYNHLSTMFTVKNTNYKVSLNTNADFIAEGNMSIVLTAQPQWPAYYYSQALVDYMTENGYTKVSFKVYVDQAGSATTLSSVEGGGGLTKTVNSWYTITKDVSSITVGTTRLQFNKAEGKDMNIYLDDLQFIK